MNLFSERKALKSITTPLYRVELSEDKHRYYVTYSGAFADESDSTFTDYKIADVVFNKTVDFFSGAQYDG